MVRLGSPKLLPINGMFSDFSNCLRSLKYEFVKRFQIGPLVKTDKNILEKLIFLLKEKRLKKSYYASESRKKSFINAVGN